MSTITIVAITLVFAFFLLKLIFLSISRPSNLPKGSLGYPIIGETFSFLQAQKKDQGLQWINQRVSKYGPIFKTSLMGSPTVIIVGQAGNKFILGSDEDVLTAKQPKTVSTIAGKYSIFELTGSRYKLVKGAMVSFLKPESLQNYIKHMDELATFLFLEETKEKDTITTVTFIKKLTFTIACKILFGIQDDQIQEALFDNFSIAFKAVWSLPLNFIGTTYWRGLRARSRIQDTILRIMKTKKEEMLMGKLTRTSDIIACLLAMKAENEDEMSEQIIVDNFFTLMIASHDTSAILLSIMVWKMSKDPEIYKKVFEEQMGILKNIEGREEKHLNWGDVQKMKYTWRVAQEILRMIPPVFGSFRKALKDTSFGGCDIPKGWQVFWTAYGTHLSEDVFENAMKFDPSRFDNLSKPILPYTYIPFGGGLHTCIGNEFARVETLTIIHKLVTMYQWSTLYADEVITHQPMPYPSMGLPIKVNPIISS